MNSAIAELPPGKVDWNPVFDGADWLHCTGITPALSPSTAELTRQALKSAKRAGLTVSFDLNYRAKLWPPQRAREILTPLMQHVDVLICNEEDAAQVFGIHAGNSDVAAGKLDAEAYRNVAEQLLSRFGFKAVAITLRENLSASDNRWSACLHDSKEFYISRCYPIHVVDRWARRRVRRGPDIRLARRARAATGARVRRRGVMPEAHHRRRFQPRERGGS